MSTIRIVPSSQPPTTPHLNLMPFHISHDGPAPMSTYFLVQPHETSETTESAVLAPQTAPSLKERFLSTFRGRSIKGLKVPVPEGYVGVLLRSSTPAQSKPRQRGKTANGRRRTRSSLKRSASPVPDDQDDFPEYDARETEDAVPGKELRVEGTFNGFVVWHPDTEVDPTEDAYMRGLDEWIRLSAVVNEIDDDVQGDQQMN